MDESSLSYNKNQFNIDSVLTARNKYQKSKKSITIYQEK